MKNRFLHLFLSSIALTVFLWMAFFMGYPVVLAHTYTAFTVSSYTVSLESARSDCIVGHSGRQCYRSLCRDI